MLKPDLESSYRSNLLTPSRFLLVGAFFSFFPRQPWRSSQSAMLLPVIMSQKSSRGFFSFFFYSNVSKILFSQAYREFLYERLNSSKISFFNILRIHNIILNLASKLGAPTLSAFFYIDKQPPEADAFSLEIGSLIREALRDTVFFRDIRCAINPIFCQQKRSNAIFHSGE